MSQESYQKRAGRVRPARVHITYDVETGGAATARELPFVVGVLADLGGKSKASVELKDRKFVDVNPSTFNSVFEKIAPRLELKVDNKLNDDDTQLGFELNFTKLEDFEPQNVAAKIEPLRILLEERTRLANLQSSLSGNKKLEKFLEEILKNTDTLNSRLRSEVTQAEQQPKPGEES